MAKKINIGANFMLILKRTLKATIMGIAAWTHKNHKGENFFKGALRYPKGILRM